MDLQTSIEISTSLRSQNYFFVSLAFFWVYDCFLTLDQDVSLIHGPTWKKASILYVMARYLPAFVFCVHLYMNYLPSEKYVTCKFLHSMWYCASAFCVSGAEGIFILRTYALWGNKKSILGLMFSTILCLVIADVIMTITISSRLELQLSDMGGGCYSLAYNKMAAFPWTLLVIFELEIIVLTMIRVYWAYRERECLLLDILLQHNIFYFGTGLALSVMNIITIEWLPFTASDMFGTFQIVMHTIVVTRMHLQFCSTSPVSDSSESGATSFSQLTHVELQTCSHSDA
ncbi:uncharacterized protein BJ212DRAFT_956211 [Suillus subaureus]|uniref:DUF6533 domain-containing protein n=1 Tax=Suillus subaureus TaxID=48587 RepID=A0A9P7J5B2_9AGAM|nr:uncharacterized protein BJ212DRAFT_956211 [Suillus subaureus]KAG1803483.1 hypothetical protein BJ212DRAFT_956211 [Suillus subaureus]